MRSEVETTTESQKPKRVMGCFSATMIVVASMVGTGVFTTTGILLETTPSAMAVLIAWLIGGAGAFFGAVSYAELVAMYPNPCRQRPPGQRPQLLDTLRWRIQTQSECCKSYQKTLRMHSYES